jgi:hypothetical protein
VAGLAALERRHRAAPLREAPADGETDGAAADDGDARAGLSMRGWDDGGLPSLA